MAFTDTPDPILANLTDIGRQYLARAAFGTVSFKVKNFAVGREGYDDSNPVKIEALDLTQIDLQDQIFPVAPNREPVTDIELPLPKTFVANCRLKASDAVSGLGEIGLWAEVLNSDAPSEIGEEFLLALGHMPLITKTERQIIIFRIIIQF